MSDSSDSVTATSARQAQVLAGHARFLFTMAARAPSVHNTQPWRWRIGHNTVTLTRPRAEEPKRASAEATMHGALAGREVIR